MTKHEFKMKDTDYSSTINHIRFGHSWKTEGGLKLYGEIGAAESVSHGKDILDGVAGKSYEFGFSKKITDAFSWKGKWVFCVIFTIGICKKINKIKRGQTNACRKH
jgi:hypothetical protein